jgi:hypothetical protein
MAFKIRNKRKVDKRQKRKVNLVKLLRSIFDKLTPEQQAKFYGERVSVCHALQDRNFTVARLIIANAVMTDNTEKDSKKSLLLALDAAITEQNKPKKKRK